MPSGGASSKKARRVDARNKVQSGRGRGKRHGLNKKLEEWWASKREKLQHMLPLDAQDEGIGSWLFGRHVGGELRLGCKPCFLAGCKGALGEVRVSGPVKVGDLRRHQRGPSWSGPLEASRTG